MGTSEIVEPERDRARRDLASLVTNRFEHQRQHEADPRVRKVLTKFVAGRATRLEVPDLEQQCAKNADSRSAPLLRAAAPYRRLMSPWNVRVRKCRVSRLCPRSKTGDLVECAGSQKMNGMSILVERWYAG
jgi:hypothetical protein